MEQAKLSMQRGSLKATTISTPAVAVLDLRPCPTKDVRVILREFPSVAEYGGVSVALLSNEIRQGHPYERNSRSFTPHPHPLQHTFEGLPSGNISSFDGALQFPNRGDAN